MTLTTLCPHNIAELVDDGQPSDNHQAYEVKLPQGGDFYAVFEILGIEDLSSEGGHWEAPVRSISVTVRLESFMAYLAEINGFVRTYCPPVLENALCEWAEFEIGNTTL